MPRNNRTNGAVCPVFGPGGPLSQKLLCSSCLKKPAAESAAPRLLTFSLSVFAGAGQVVEIGANNGRQFIVSDTYTKEAISRGGRHFGVEIDGIVYDNIHKNGIPYGEWIKDFNAPDGISILSKTEF